MSASASLRRTSSGVIGRFPLHVPESSVVLRFTGVVPDALGGAAPLIGRRDESASLERLLSGTDQGAACLVIEGEAGMGKTTLLEAAVAHARAGGMTVLTCSPTQAEMRLPFVALGDLLDPIPPQILATLPAPQREALEIALLRAPAGPRPLTQRAIGIALISLVRCLTQSSALLVAVDDAQWLDAASADVLEFIVRRLDREPVSLLVSVRLTSEPCSTFDRTIAPDRREVCRLRGLSVADVHGLLSAHFGASFARPDLHRITDMSGGNPLHALEVARELGRCARAPTLEHVIASGDIAHLIEGRLRRLPRRIREALLVAAAISHPTVDTVDCAALAPAERARIVRIGTTGSIAFTHPLFASAIYAICAPAKRRALHAQLAALVPTADERARHRDWQPRHLTRRLRRRWSRAPPTRGLAERGTLPLKCSSRRLPLRHPICPSRRAAAVLPRPSFSCTRAIATPQASNFNWSCEATSQVRTARMRCGFSVRFATTMRAFTRRCRCLPKPDSLRRSRRWSPASSSILPTSHLRSGITAALRSMRCVLSSSLKALLMTACLHRPSPSEQ